MQIQARATTRPHRSKPQQQRHPQDAVKDRVSEGESDPSFIDRMKDLAKRALKGLARPKLPVYKDGEKPFEAEIDRFDFKDEERGREVPVTVYYPKDKSQLESSPVVVMSHGLAGNGLTYRYFGKHLAEHGYTVLQPTHVGSDTFSFVRDPGIDIFSQKELIERGQDVSFVLDQLEQGGFGDTIKSKVDMEKVALAGHSFGALTAQAMAGVVVKDFDGSEVPVEDPRLDAFIAMSPYGDSMPTHLLGMDPTSYGRIDKPLLTLSGDKDSLFTGTEGPRVHLDTFHAAGSREKYHVIVGDTFHASFAQVFGTFGPTKDVTNSTSLAFLDANLKGQEEARDYLVHDLPKVARTHKSLAFVGTRCDTENCQLDHEGPH